MLFEKKGTSLYFIWTLVKLTFKTNFKFQAMKICWGFPSKMSLSLSKIRSIQLKVKATKDIAHIDCHLNHLYITAALEKIHWSDKQLPLCCHQEDKEILGGDSKQQWLMMRRIERSVYVYWRMKKKKQTRGSNSRMNWSFKLGK